MLYDECTIKYLRQYLLTNPTGHDGKSSGEVSEKGNSNVGLCIYAVMYNVAGSFWKYDPYILHG